MSQIVGNVKVTPDGVDLLVDYLQEAFPQATSLKAVKLIKSSTVEVVLAAKENQELKVQLGVFVDEAG